MPTVGSILMDPMGSNVPTDPSVLYAVSTAIPRHVDSMNIGSMMAYAKRLPQEFATLMVKDTVARTPHLKATREYIAFEVANQRNF